MKIIKEKVVLTKFELVDVCGEEYTVYLNSVLSLAHTIGTDNTDTTDTYAITFVTEDFLYTTERIYINEEDWCKIKELIEEGRHLSINEHKCSSSVTYEYYFDEPLETDKE